MIQCTTCNKAFASKRILTRHYSTVAHSNRVNMKDTMFTCNCGQIFKYKSGLFRHKRVCTCNDEPQTPEELPCKEDEPTEADIEHTLREEIVSMRNKFEKEIHNLTIKNMTLLLKIERIKQLKNRKINVRKKLNANERNQVRENQDNLCGICKKDITKVFQIDHVIALQYGGTNTMDNLMALCCECHSTKSIAENKCRNEIKESIANIIQKHM